MLRYSSLSDYARFWLSLAAPSQRTRSVPCFSLGVDGWRLSVDWDLQERDRPWLRLPPIEAAIPPSHHPGQSRNRAPSAGRASAHTSAVTSGLEIAGTFRLRRTDRSFCASG